MNAQSLTTAQLADALALAAPALSADQLNAAALCMQRMGGSFAASIAAAYIHADSNNRPRLVAAFPELFNRYAKEAQQ